MKRSFCTFLCALLLCGVAVQPLRSAAADTIKTTAVKNEISVTGENLCGGENAVILNDTEKGISGAVQINKGSAIFSFSAPEDGLYNIEITYFSGYDNETTPYETGLRIDNAYPLEQASSFVLSRVWSHTASEEYDRLGNQLLPSCVQNTVRRTEVLKDSERYESEPLKFSLSAGAHTLTLEAPDCQLVLCNLRLYTAQNPISYEEYISGYKASGVTEATKSVHIEAEQISAKSTRSLTPVNDRTSPKTMPYDSNLLRYNAIGGDKWKNAGEWIEWKIDVPETGLYTLAMRWKQDGKESAYSSRAIYIDGEIPFSEARAVDFSYDSVWQVTRIGAEEPYRFYLTAGEHTLRMETVMGQSASLIKEVGALVTEMNGIYLEIVMITGPDPDKDRDYGFEKLIPQTITRMCEVSQRLSEIESTIAKSSGIGSSSAGFKTTCRKLDAMTSDPVNIAYELSSFKDAISSLSNWQTSAMLQPLQLDWIELLPPSDTLPRSDAGFFERLWYQLCQLVVSYSADYDSVGQMSDKCDENINVWLSGSGMEQGQVIRQMTYDFTEQSGAGVSFRLVNGGSLLPATLAGIGPDVAIAQPQTEPVNFALRGAVADLSGMDGFNEVSEWFDESALTPFRFGGGVYAIPETQSFPMLFVRTDIMEMLGISLDSLNTWDDIFEGVLAKIQNNYLEFGISSGMDGFSMLFFQQNGSYYTQNQKESALNSTEGVNAFTKFTELFTDYKQPIAFDFSNRFRSGEMPIAITDISAYNQLSVFAPEIKGEWVMLPVPGTRGDDGVINRSVATTVTGSVMFSKSNHKKTAWEFIKWWCSAEIQSQYADSLEALLGTAGRYFPANTKAAARTGWNKTTAQSLSVQREWLKTVEEVAGGYYTSRHFNFAFRQVVYNSRDPREALDDAAASINREIKNKREEFSLQ